MISHRHRLLASSLLIPIAFSGRDSAGANTNTDLDGTNLSKADQTNANPTNANLYHRCLTNTTVSNTIFSAAFFFTTRWIDGLVDGFLSACPTPSIDTCRGVTP